MRARLLIAALCVMCGCGGQASSEDPLAEPPPLDNEAVDVAAPISGAADPRAPEVAADDALRAEAAAVGAAPPTAVVEQTAAESSACTLSEPQRVRPGDAWFDVAATERGFVVGGVARVGDQEQVFLAAFDGAGRPGAHIERPLARGATRRRAAPRMVVRGPVTALLLSDGERHLRLFQARLSGAETTLNMSLIAEGASLQFAPAILSTGPDRWLLAWTDERTETRRVLAARVQGRRADPPTDLTPISGSACAPTFVNGANPATLLFVDAREALSAAYSVDVSGPLATPVVARPINMLTDPPRLEAAVAGTGDATQWVTFTGIGAGATTAVGVFPLHRRAAPTTVVAGTGYGALYADLTPVPAGVLIAADVPQARPPGSPRQIHLRAVGGDGLPGPALTVRGPAGTAARARVASRGSDIAVAFQGQQGVFVALGRCR